jgi:hypothetical protein
VGAGIHAAQQSSIKQIAKDFPYPFMSYPYSSLYLEAHRANQQLTQAFRDQPTGNDASPAPESIRATIEQEGTVKKPRLSTKTHAMLFALLRQIERLS